MESVDFFRVVQDEHSSWTGLKAVMVGYDDGDWCVYEYHPLDRLLILDFFDANGDFVEWEGYYEGENPLPSMWEDHPARTEEPWFDMDFESGCAA